jgi:hypothetical protein
MISGGISVLHDKSPALEWIGNVAVILAFLTLSTAAFLWPIGHRLHQWMERKPEQEQNRFRDTLVITIGMFLGGEGILPTPHHSVGILVLQGGGAVVIALLLLIALVVEFVPERSAS